MNIPSIIVVFVVWWWVVFLALLPTGIKSRWEGEDDGVVGADPGAPQDPQLKKKAIRATIGSLILTIVTCAIIISGLIDFRE